VICLLFGICNLDFIYDASIASTLILVKKKPASEDEIEGEWRGVIKGNKNPSVWSSK